MTGSAATSLPSSAGSSVGASSTPTLPRARSAPRSPSHSASGTMIGSRSGRSVRLYASGSSVQRSSTSAPFLMSCGIDALLERIDADAAHRVDEGLLGFPALDENVDDLRDHVGHFGGGERRSDHLPERGVEALRAADRDLVPLLAALVDAEDA